MILTRRLLFVLVLCAPLCVFADNSGNSDRPDDAPDIKELQSNISSATTINDAITKYNDAFTQLSDYYSNTSDPKVDPTAITAQKTIIDTNITKAKQCNADTNNNSNGTSNQTTSTTDSGTGSTDQDAEKLEKLQDNYDEAKATEQSLANRTLTSLTTAATGIGGMELAMGLSQQKADKEAEADMAAYIASMHCTYGDGKQVDAGPEEIELPGANDQTLMNLRAQYIALAADLKERKEALGMKAGIESEEILDKSQMGLYDQENVGIDGGKEASLYRAQMLGSEEDQARIDEDKAAAKKRVIAGGVLAGAGVVGGIAGNAIINGELGEKLKDAIKSKKTGTHTQSLLKKEENALKDLRSCLKSAGIKETEKLSFSNFYPSVLSVSNITCDSNLVATDKKANTAQQLFIDSTDASMILFVLRDSFGDANAGKMIGYNAITSTNESYAETHLKSALESIEKKFDDAYDKDKDSASKLGIDLGSITSSGSGLFNKSSLFSGISDLGSGEGSASSFLNLFGE